MRGEQQQRVYNKAAKISKFKELLNECPDCIFGTLNYKDIIKPLLWADLSVNGGKLSYRGAARKYKITLDEVTTIIKNIKKTQNTK